MRKLLNGDVVVAFMNTKTLTVKTKCPEKWKLIDMETGEEYIGYGTDGKHCWRKLSRTK
jgi:hypothetical protein